MTPFARLVLDFFSRRCPGTSSISRNGSTAFRNGFAGTSAPQSWENTSKTTREFRV